MGRMVSYIRSHRLLVGLTLAGLAWCIATAVTLWPTAPQLSTYEQPQGNGRNYKPGGTSCEPAAISALRPAERQGKRDACAKEAEEHRQVEADLVQQSRAADAAQASAWLTHNQSIILLYGMIFGGATLLAAIAAATFARDAASHAGTGAATAKRALEGLERPFLYLTLSKGSGFPETPSGPGAWRFVYGVVATNYGRSPAIIRKFESEILHRTLDEYRKQMEVFAQISPPDPVPDLAILVAAGKAHAFDVNDIQWGSAEERAHVALIMGWDPFFVTATVVYEDTMGSVWERHSRWRLDRMKGLIEDGGAAHNYEKKLN